MIGKGKRRDFARFAAEHTPRPPRKGCRRRRAGQVLAVDASCLLEALVEMADVQNNQSRKKGRDFCLERLTEAPSKEQAKREIDRGLAMIAKRLNVPKETERDASIDAIDASVGS